MKKLSLLLLLTISPSSIFAMEDDAKHPEPFEFPRDQEGRIFTRSYRPPVVHESPDAVVVDLQASDSDDDSARQEPFEYSGDEEFAPGARSPYNDEEHPAPAPADYTVTLGQEFTVALEEEGGATKYRYDQHYSSTNFFKLVREYHAFQPRTHYFVFKAVCQGRGTLHMIGERNSPPRIWMQSYQVVVE